MPRSLRLLWRSKRFVALAVSALGIAIALNTTIYSVMEALVHPASAMHNREHLYRYAFYGEQTQRVTQQERNRDVAAMPFVIGAAGSQLNFETHIAEHGRNFREVMLEDVTPTFFNVAQVQPMHGRLLGQSDLDAAGSPVVVSDRVWEALFPDSGWVNGASISVDGEPHAVVGVVADMGRVGVWRLFPSDALLEAPITTVRVRPGISKREVEGGFAALGRAWAERHGMDPSKTALRVSPATGEPFQYRHFHLALIGAVIALMLVACVNLANLQLARGVSRARELATRSAIGATRRDLVLQLVEETSWIALGGLLLGILLTFWAMHVVGATLPLSLEEYLVRPRVSWRLFVFAALAAVVCLAGIGLLPALRLSRVDVGEVLKSGAGTGASKRAGRQYGALVVVQVGLALPLVVAGALLMRTAVLTLAVDTSRYHNMVTGMVSARRARSTDEARALATRMVAEMRAAPGVADAAYEGNDEPVRRMISLDDPGGAAREIPTGLWHYTIASPSLLRTWGVRIRRGRDFQEGEFAEPVAIVNEESAAFLFHGADPVGRLIKLGPLSSDAPWIRIIGVSESVEDWHHSLVRGEIARSTPTLSRIYVLDAPARTRGLAPFDFAWYFIYARATNDVTRLPVVLRRQLAPLAAEIRLFRLATYDDSIGLTRDRQRNVFVASLFAVFAALGLGVALMGVYSVVSQAVAQREREFAVRKALGASNGDIRRHVFSYGRVPCLLGIALGLIVTWKTVNLLFAFLSSENDVYDSGTFGLVSLGFFAAALFACYFPARRAVRLEPVTALRHE